MTDLKILRQIVKMMVDHGLTEVDLEDQGEKIKLKRGPGGDVQFLTPAPGSPETSAIPAAAAQTPADTSGASGGGDDEAVISPMVGTFYAASSPDVDAFVKVGDRVTSDTVVCIIEAMKVFNEIKAECSGTITEVLVESGQAVEFDQPLFKIKS